MAEDNRQVVFEIDEVLEIKSILFKITVVDAGAGKICMKQITQDEAEQLAKK